MNDASTLPLHPPLAVKIGRLNTVRDVKRELVKVYTDMRTEKIESQLGSRLAFVLVSLGKLIEQSDLESRLEQLENAMNGVPHDLRKTNLPNGVAVAGEADA